MTHIPTLLQTPETTSHSPFLSYVSCCCGFTPKIWLTGLCGPRIFDHSFSNARFTREGKQLDLVLCVLCTESSCHISRKVGWGMQSLWVTCTRIQEWLSGWAVPRSVKLACCLLVLCVLMPLPTPMSLKVRGVLGLFSKLILFACPRLSMLVPVFTSLMDPKHSFLWLKENVNYCTV